MQLLLLSHPLDLGTTIHLIIARQGATCRLAESCRSVCVPAMPTNKRLSSGLDTRVDKSTQVTGDWELTVRHQARVILLVSSVAAGWLGLFGLFGLRDLGEPLAPYRFVAPQVSIALLGASLSLVIAQLRPEFARPLAVLAALMTVLTLVAGRGLSLWQSHWLSFEVLGYVIVWVAICSVWVLGDARRLLLYAWPDRASIVMTVLGTLFSIGGAYWLVAQESRQTQRMVETRVEEIAETLNDSLKESIAVFSRMAERWNSLDHPPSLSYIDLEFLSYLRDMPHASTIVALDANLDLVHGRPDSTQGYEDMRHLVSEDAPSQMLAQIRDEGRVDLITPHLSPDPDRVGFVAAGWGNDKDWGGIVLTTLDVPKLVERAFHLRQVPCCLEVLSEGIPVFQKTRSSQQDLGTQAGTGSGSTTGADETDLKIYLASTSFELSGENYQVRYWINPSEPLSMQNPFALVFLGLGLVFTFIVNNSQRLAYIANARARQVQHRALHDVITELPNRQMLEQYLEGYCQEHRHCERPVSLLLLSMEGLRLINDSIGHAVGDGLLRATAAKVRERVPHTSMVARIDGGHFAICVLGLSRTELDTLAADLVHAVAEPVRVEPHLLRVSSVIGIASSIPNAIDAGSLLRQADLAMLEARKLGRDTWCHYTGDLGAAVSERMSISTDLQNAVQDNQLTLHYQPVVDGWTGAIVGYEALMRWYHPSHGFIPPNRFIPMAEESGQIVELTQWALDCAARAATRMNQGLPHDIYVAVNISTLVFRRTDFVERVTDVLERHNIPARWLEIEITESMLLDDFASAIEKLRELGALGVRIALDDFGTGYSSLNYLKRLPIHKIKLDRSFVNDIVEDPADAAIARAVLAVAGLLKLTVIVEGVETERQFAFLKRLRFTQFQGYLFAKPLPLETVLASLLAASGYQVLPDAAQPSQARSVLLIGAESVSHKTLEMLFYQTHFRVLQAHSTADAMAQLATSPVDALICIQPSSGEQTRSRIIDLFGRVRHLHPQTRRVLVADVSVRESLVDALSDGDIERMLALPLDPDSLLDLIRNDLSR